MRKDILLPALAVGGGVLGSGLRLLQWATVYDPDTQLFTAGSPVTFGLIALTAVLALTFLVLSQQVTAPQEGYPTAFRCPSTAYMALMAASALLMLAGGVLGLLEGMEQLALWRAYPETHLVTYPGALILCALLALVSGPATLILGRGAYRGNLPASGSLLVLFPPMSALAWLFATHLAHGTDPVLMGYGFSLAAVALLMVAHYDTAALFHGQPHPRRGAFCALMGVSIGLMSMGDHLSPFYAVLTTAFVLSGLASLYILLRSSFGPPWPKRLLEAQAPRDADFEDE